MLATWRWCKYNCSYCYRWVKYSNIRQISLETLKKDLDYLTNLKYKYIYIYDDCFITTNLNRLDEIIKLLNNYDFEYQLATRYEVCTSENLLKLSKLNIKRIQIWLQSISLDVNKTIKRWFNKNEFELTIQQIKNLWIKVSLDIILWLPWEWIKWFIKTFNYAVTLNPSNININSLFLNPGTELYKNKKKYWIITKTSNITKNLFHVQSIKSSNSFSIIDIKFARKYVLYYINKLKNINIVLR